MRFYGQRFAQYDGETLAVNGSRSDPAGVMVTSQIIRLQRRQLRLIGGSW
jgi:ABC-type transporter MlaC component